MLFITSSNASTSIDLQQYGHSFLFLLLIQATTINPTIGLKKLPTNNTKFLYALFSAKVAVKAHKKIQTSNPTKLATNISSPRLYKLIF